MCWGKVGTQLLRTQGQECNKPISNILLKSCPEVGRFVPTEPNPVCSLLKGFPTPLGWVLTLPSTSSAPGSSQLSPPGSQTFTAWKPQHMTTNLAQCLCQGNCCLSSWFPWLIKHGGTPDCQLNGGCSIHHSSRIQPNGLKAAAWEPRTACSLEWKTHCLPCSEIPQVKKRGKKPKQNPLHSPAL